LRTPPVLRLRRGPPSDPHAGLYLGMWRRARPEAEPRIAWVNGWPALVVATGDLLRSVIQIRTDGERVRAIDAMLNPDKLGRLAAALGLRVSST